MILNELKLAEMSESPLKIRFLTKMQELEWPQMSLIELKSA